VAGGVHDVDANALPFDRSALGEDRDAPLALDVVAVHGALGDRLVLAEGAGLLEELVHQGCLAVVDVRDDRDVADIHGALFRGTARRYYAGAEKDRGRPMQAVPLCSCHIGDAGLSRKSLARGKMPLSQ
jgi:hypothetical protein